MRDAREAKMEVSWGRPDRREARQTGASHDFYVSGPCDDRHHSQAESPTGGQAGGGGGADPEPGLAFGTATPGTHLRLPSEVLFLLPEAHF